MKKDAKLKGISLHTVHRKVNPAVNRTINRSANRPVYRTIYRVELIAVMFLILLIVCGGLYAILRSQNERPLFRIGKSAGKNSTLTQPAEEYSKSSVFNGIGRLRIPVAGQYGSATMVLSIAFPYPPEDHAFTEELALRITSFRSITIEYFSSLSSEEIKNLGEESAKRELLKLFNSILRLGEIETLYFNDLMIIEAETQ